MCHELIRISYDSPDLEPTTRTDVCRGRPTEQPALIVKRPDMMSNNCKQSIGNVKPQQHAGTHKPTVQFTQQRYTATGQLMASEQMQPAEATSRQQRRRRQRR